MTDSEIEIEVEHDGDYHRLQIDGADIVSIQEHGDGTGYMIVYASCAEDAAVVWEGPIKLT